jgi:asparagine synthase (glutamine-hydrolysing)
MCGFAGEFVFTGTERADPAIVETMAGYLDHRGPDEAGNFTSDDGLCAIGFRRLSVIDPPLSHQPMVSPDGLTVVAFNGEIYNFPALRDELSAKGYTFKTRGDTEVLLALWRQYGEAMPEKLTGMFAFAIHDARKGKLFLARDRLGQKPLWYAMLPDRIVFASEAKALTAHPSVRREVNPQAVAFYLTLGYVPAPMSIWRGIAKLPPAHCMTVTDSSSEPRPYWSLPDRPADISGNDAVEQVREALTASVQRRMVADVPLGALLSGGVDSSIIVALMCRLAGDEGGVKTFTAGFTEGDFDVRPFATEVAKHLGTDHHELLISPSQFNIPTLLDKLVAQYDEPFADSSALPTYLICRAAREHVTVALTGDGGDEAFGGYDRYRAMRLAEVMGPGRWLGIRAAAGLAAIIAPHDERSRLRRLVRFAEGLDKPPAKQYFTYRRLFSPEQLQLVMERDFAAEADVNRPSEWFCGLYEQGEFADEIAYAQRHDLLTYLPDDLLVKTDIASMANSLELRSPMLDHEVVSLGLSLPADCKIQGRRGKAILRDAFGYLLPNGVFTRRKRGFGVPVHDWLRNELRETLRESLLGGPLISRGWLARMPMERMIDEHLARQADHRHRLWALLWLGRWMVKENIE